MRKVIWFLCVALGMTASRAQTVEILAADQILRDPAITEAQRLIGNVVLGHEDGVLHCDSAWRYDNGQVDVFSNIRLNQPPSTVLTADFLQLDPESEWASASGQVQLQHEEASLEAPALAYQLASRQARYSAGAIIQEDGWDVTSQTGSYLAEEQLLQLGGDVVAMHERDTLRSDSVHWMRAEQRYLFHGATEWSGADIAFTCLRGDLTMEEERTEGWLAGEVHVRDEEGTIAGDSLQLGEDASEVWGAVTLVSSDGLSEAHGSHAQRNSRDSTEVIVGDTLRRAWIRQIEDADTLHLAGETLSRRGETLTATRRVTLVQADLTGVGDSLVWDDAVETIRVWGQPELWSNRDRLAGDSLTLWLSDQQPDKLEMRGHASVLSPANDTLAHRIQGRDLDAHFEAGELKTVDVIGNGEVNYFEVPGGDGQTAVRLNAAKCAQVTLSVVDRKLQGIALQQQPNGTISPVKKGMKLGAFRVGEAPRFGPWETSEQAPLPE